MLGKLSPLVDLDKVLEDLENCVKKSTFYLQNTWYGHGFNKFKHLKKNIDQYENNLEIAEENVNNNNCILLNEYDTEICEHEHEIAFYHWQIKNAKMKVCI